MQPHKNDDDVLSVQHFKQFLQIKTITAEGPKGAYHEAVHFLKQLLEEAGLKTQIVELIANKPILIGSLIGQEPELPSILLNSHYDVVPAVYEKWNVDPFGAVEDENGDIFARGTQDMKVNPPPS